MPPARGEACVGVNRPVKRLAGRHGAALIIRLDRIGKVVKAFDQNVDAARFPLIPIIAAFRYALRDATAPIRIRIIKSINADKVGDFFISRRRGGKGNHTDR